MSKTKKRLKQFSIKVYEDAEQTVERILLNGITDFKKIITMEAQRAGVIADPHVYYDKPTKSLVIEQFQEDRGLVFILEKDALKLVQYKDVADNSNYAQLDATASCYRIYVKQPQVDHPVNVALDEGSLVDLFNTVTYEDLLPPELDMSEEEKESAKEKAPIMEVSK